MTPIVYRIAERPEVEVNVAGDWHYGQLRMWTRRPDGSWWAQVTWRRAPGENMIDRSRRPASDASRSPDREAHLRRRRPRDLGRAGLPGAATRKLDLPSASSRMTGT